MSDAAPPEDVLRAFEIASDPVRFALLGYAASEGGFRASRAAGIVGEDPGSGTVRTVHARALTEADLLTRLEHPVRYEITLLGRSVHAALSAAVGKVSHSAVTPDQVAVLMLVDRCVYEDVVVAGGEDADLVLALRSRLRSAISSQIAFRLSRVDRD